MNDHIPSFPCYALLILQSDRIEQARVTQFRKVELILIDIVTRLIDLMLHLDHFVGPAEIIKLSMNQYLLYFYGKSSILPNNECYMLLNIL